MDANETVINDFIDKHPFAAAQALEQVSSEEVVDFLQTLSLQKNEKLLRLMNAKKGAECLVLMPADRSSELIEQADASLIASLFMFVETPVRSKLLTNISSDKRATIKRQLSFLPNSIATLMESAVMISIEMSVDNALQLFKRNTTAQEFYLYVVDLDGNFKGIVRLKELFVAEPFGDLKEVIIKTVPTLLSDISVKTIIEHPGWLEYQEMPVIDTSGKLLGKLTHRSTMQFKTKVKNSSYEIEETGNALGELFRIGLNGLLQGGGK